MCSRQNPTIFILPKNSLNKVKEGRLKKHLKPGNREAQNVVESKQIISLLSVFFSIALFPKNGKL